MIFRLTTFLPLVRDAAKKVGAQGSVLASRQNRDPVGYTSAIGRKLTGNVPNALKESNLVKRGFFKPT